MIDKSLTGHTDSSSDPRHYEYAVAVRFHNSGRSYTFGTDRDDFKLGDRVVVETSQGMELGICQNASMHTRYLGKTKQPEKPVLRLADEEDLRNFEENIEYAKDALAVCEEEVKDLALEMHLLSSEYMLDRSKILFVYQAEHRVDFRELLKRLGARLHCRIELRQIGERDKAKMVGGIGLCGMECCCARFKTKTDVISINMAKNQMLALNIDKLSGMCGKLMCCLKYEDSDYKEAINGLPKMGSQVEYEGTIYRITSMNVMNSEAKLENRETALFITFDELREKAIPRKGAVMARKPGTEEKKVIYKTVQRTTPKTEPERPAKVSMELPSLAEKKPEKRKENSGRHNNNDRKQNRDHRRNGNDARRERRQEKTRPEVKNVTVRTFGRKKKQENEA